MHILIVDDDLVDQEFVSRTLRHTQQDVEITTTTSVDQALALCACQPFDVILLDYRMPQRDGIELLDEIRQQPTKHQTAIVMMSTSSDNQLAMACVRAGAHDFIIKTDITVTQLERAILHARTRLELEQKLIDSYEKARRLSEQDSLTGLSNRSMFDERFRQAILNNDNTRHQVALLLIDLDHFKNINDHHGHDVGDEVLCAVVDRLRAGLEGPFDFARLGGDEFAITLSRLNHPDQAQVFAQKIISILNTPIHINAIKVLATASIGIVLYPEFGHKSDDLFKFADIAMYRAKSMGRNQACVFESRMQDEFRQRYETETRLRDAISPDQMRLHYQPVFEGSEDQLYGFEALLRWYDEDEVRLPREFIRIAEESQLINGIGRLAIRTAIAQIARWNRCGQDTLVMAINVSPVQLEDTELVTFIHSCIIEHQVDPQWLEFELTETALLDNAHDKLATICALSELGCKLALDDFGTGYSSLSHLQKFPIDTVKFDKSLMPAPTPTGVEEDNLLMGNQQRTLLKGLTLMIHSLSMDTVAEGIETRPQLDYCRELGIHRFQGYYFSEPAPEGQITRRYFSGPNQTLSV